MSFGKNPHVAKAESAEQKARDAKDNIAREQAWLEAARRWERAAERETDDKRRQLYADKSEYAREQALLPPNASRDPSRADTVSGPTTPAPGFRVKPKSTLPN